MTTSRRSTFKRYCAAAVAASLALQPFAAYSATITTSTLTEIPLQGLNPVKPNIVLTIDDSASMNNNYLPDFTQERAGLCRDGQVCGATLGRFGTILTADPPIRSSAFNGQFYDPTANYLPGLTSDGLPLPCEGTDVSCGAPWTSVYVNAYAGYPSANTGGTTNLITGYPDTAYCNNLAATPPSASDLATAYGDGTICRLNGRPYARLPDSSGLWTVPAVAAGYNYPNRNDPLTGSSTVCGGLNEKCIFGDFVGVTARAPVIVFANPFYYTISKVQFCSTRDINGFGKPPCQSRFDATTFTYARYGTDPNKSFDPRAFTRVDITPTGFLVNGVPTSTNPSGTGKSVAQEMSNFAKWYAFDRTRLLAMKTATGRAFSVLNDTTARVGLHTLGENDTLFRSVLPFDPQTNKPAWFTNLYAVNPPAGSQTPLPDAVFRMGEYFRTGTAPGINASSTDPLDATTGQCQSNYHLVATDGYWNVPLSLGNVGDQDGVPVPTTPVPVAGLTTGMPFPRPYLDANGNTNTLSDLAMKYWITDLRALPNKVPDKFAPWQHVSLYGVSIGAQGNIVYPSGLIDITGDPNATPPVLPSRDWPAVTGAGGPESIDDLWHAALNSRGKFFNASNPQELANSIISAVNDFLGPNGTGSGVGIASAQLTSTKRFGYLTSYDSTWAGDVKKYALDARTGAIPVDSVGNPLNAPLWSAQVQLDTQVIGTGWLTSRRIVTISDPAGVGVPFLNENLSTRQQASLIAGWSSAAPALTSQDVVNYLRGDKSNEGVGPTNFRVRSHALGDIVYSGAVPVGAPSEPYDDAGNPGFQLYASNLKTRTPMVYVGANDGMLHAFIDPTGCNTQSDCQALGAGQETWAYVPRALFSSGDPNDDGHAPDPAFQIGALSYNPGIPFKHRFYVNATPRVWSIDFKNTDTSTPPTLDNDWRTLLVGGLGAGGRAVYALDVTNPLGLPPPAVSADTEATAASKVLWEYTETNLGNVFDAPTLVKTRAKGWVVLIASGYNNPGGRGFLYVLNPRTGELHKKIELPGDTGNDFNPTGLSTVRAFTASRRDPYVLQAYSGDLNGNVWRFDLSGSSTSDWKAELIATLKDGAGNAQPITTGVRIEIDQNNNVDRYLFVGTGKLLGQPDIEPSDPRSHAVTNSLYVIRDGTRTAAEAAPTRPYSRLDLNSVNGATVAGFTAIATGRGWFQDGSDMTEKIGTDVFADVQTVVYSFSKPTTDPCLGELTSNLFARDLTTGNSVLQSGGGDVVASVSDIGAIAGVALIQGQAGTGSVAGDVRVQVTTMKGQVFSFGVNLAGGPTNKHRVSWRLLNRE